MMSGLSLASLLTLVFVPAGYLLLFWFDSAPLHRFLPEPDVSGRQHR
jgi:hypothetical protein